QASALQLQAAKLGAKATKAKAAQNMQRRDDRLLDGLEDQRQADRVAKLRFPDPAPSGKTPLTAGDCRSPTGPLRCSPTWTWPSTGAAAWWCSASTARARPRCCGCSLRWKSRTPAR